MTSLYTSRQIRNLEQSVIKSGIDEYTLMQRAGQAAFDKLLEHWPQTTKLAVCCGKGNNAGDGFVLARLAESHGIVVDLFCIVDPDELKPTAQKAANAAVAQGLEIRTFPEKPEFDSDLIIDALLGTGLRDDVSKAYESVIAAMNDSGIPIFSLDVPSGIDADTGSKHGCAIHAEQTITFLAPKQGLYTSFGPACSGEINIADLGVSQKLFENFDSKVELLNWDNANKVLHKRQQNTHKGSYGHVLVIGGDYGMGGAVRMAAETAARVGAGLVTVATRPEHVPIVSGSRPELMCHQVSEPDDLDPLISRATVIVIGPGLGKTDWAKSLFHKVLTTDLPKLLDADCLNLLSEAPQKRDDWILTPHPGEACRLLTESCKTIQQDRFAGVRKLQTTYGGIAILKGAGTLVCDQSSKISVCPAGNPGMATGGMGDVLSGVIGGLLAQQLSLAVAASVGVLVHSLAGDLAAAEGGERGLLATDLLPQLRTLVNPGVGV